MQAQSARCTPETMAARPGFEPGSAEPKSAVLPLHHRALGTKSESGDPFVHRLLMLPVRGSARGQRPVRCPRVSVDTNDVAVSEYIVTPCRSGSQMFEGGFVVEQRYEEIDSASSPRL